MKISFDTIAHYLTPISLVYLAIPYFIFLAGWLNQYTAILPILLVALPLITLCLKTRQSVPSLNLDQTGISVRQLGLIVVVISLIMLISGAGGIGAQDSDWKKHNALMQDLQERSWPVIYSRDGVSLPLVYMVAYYLPAALLGKLTDNTTAQIGLFFWTFIGLLLAVLWFLVLVRKKPIVSLVVFLLFSGLDIIGVGIHELLLGAPPDPWDHLEWWARNWQYSSHITQIFWVPQHAISGWIMSGILFYAMLYRPQREAYLYHISLLPLWSLFSTAGLIPFLMVDFWATPGPLLTRVKQYLSFSNLCGLLIMGLLSIFFLSKFVPIPLPLKQPELGLIFIFPRVIDMPATMVLLLLVCFLILELGVFVIIIARHTSFTKPEMKWLFTAGLLFVTITTLFRFGRNNDLAMRGAIPTLFLAAVLFARVVATIPEIKKTSRLKHGVLIGIILIGSVTPIVEVGRHLYQISQTGLIQIPQPAQVQSIIELNKKYMVRSRLIQYVGSPDSPFFTWLVDDTTCQIPPGAMIVPQNQTVVDVLLSDRFTLLCSYFQRVENALIINLLLQTAPVPDHGEETHDTIYVHLLNSQGERLVGSDILLFKNYEDVTVSTHQLTLPPDLPKGQYFLRVGTYYFEDGELVPVGATSINSPVMIQ